MTGSQIAEITNIVNLYPIAVDTQQWHLFDQVFTDDISADFGGQAVWHGLAGLKEAFAMIHAPFAATQHSTRGHHVRIAGTEATCLSYVHGRFIRDASEGSMFESCGWYDDALVETASGWRIRSRICRSVWWGGNPAVLETAPGVKIDPVLDSLRVEADHGRIAHLSGLVLA